MGEGRGDGGSDGGRDGDGREGFGEAGEGAHS